MLDERHREGTCWDQFSRRCYELEADDVDDATYASLSTWHGYKVYHCIKTIVASLLVVALLVGVAVLVSCDFFNVGSLRLCMYRRTSSWSADEIVSDDDATRGRLLLGDAQSSRDLRQLFDHNVTNVLSLVKLSEDAFYTRFSSADQNAERNRTQHLALVEVSGDCSTAHDGYHRFRTLWMDVTDKSSTNIKQHFNRTNAFIVSALHHDRNVLVHCQYGVSRSATIVIAYLMHEYCLTLDDALERTRAHSHVVDPNPGFIEQLTEYETELLRGRCKE